MDFGSVRFYVQLISLLISKTWNSKIGAAAKFGGESDKVGELSAVVIFELEAYPEPKILTSDELKPLMRVWGSTVAVAKFLGCSQSHVSERLNSKNKVRAFSNQYFDYAYGFIIHRIDGREIIFHSGNTPGFTSEHVWDRASGISIFILSNRKNFPVVDRSGNSMTISLLKLILGLS